MAEQFAARLRRLRGGKSWTEAELAGRVGVTAEAVAQWEKGLGEPSWSTLVDLAHALGVSVAALRRQKDGATRRRTDRKTSPRDQGDTGGLKTPGANRGRRKKRPGQSRAENSTAPPARKPMPPAPTGPLPQLVTPGELKRML